MFLVRLSQKLALRLMYKVLFKMVPEESFIDYFKKQMSKPNVDGKESGGGLLFAKLAISQKSAMIKISTLKTKLYNAPTTLACCTQYL